MKWLSLIYQSFLFYWVRNIASYKINKFTKHFINAKQHNLTSFSSFLESISERTQEWYKWNTSNHYQKFWTFINKYFKDFAKQTLWVSIFNIVSGGRYRTVWLSIIPKTCYDSWFCSCPFCSSPCPPSEADSQFWGLCGWRPNQTPGQKHAPALHDLHREECSLKYLVSGAIFCILFWCLVQYVIHCSGAWCSSQVWCLPTGPGFTGQSQS